VEFLALYNELHESLRESCGDANASFSKALDLGAKKSNAVGAHRAELARLRDLRNVIVHESKGQLEFIAEPTMSTIQRLRSMSDAVRSPGLALSLCTAKPRVFEAADQVGEALLYMREKDYSQVVVENHGHHHGLTSEGIARWIAACVPDEYAFTECSLGQVLGHERQGAVLFVPRSFDVYDARAAFWRSPLAGESRLAALLVTHSGGTGETPLGVVTPWDVMDHN